MTFYLVKIIITATLIVIISEISKSSSFFAAILASVPLVSVLAMIWLYIETRDVGKIASLATDIFWLVIPSLALFVALPILLKQGINFYLSLGISVGITATIYWLMIAILRRVGITL